MCQQMVDLDVDQLASRLDVIVKTMQKHFSYKPGAYYNHALFFLSIALHRVMPSNMHKVIMLDADLKFRDDIKKLYDEFDNFKEDNIIGESNCLNTFSSHVGSLASPWFCLSYRCPSCVVCHLYHAVISTRNN